MGVLISLKEKGESSLEKDNFLYFFSDQNIYIMDNHRLSLWCWLNFIKDNFGKFTLIYLDKHIDCRCDAFKERYKIFSENKNKLVILDEFKNLKYDSKNLDKLSLIDSGNFLAFAIKLEILKNIFIFTGYKDDTVEEYLRKQTTIYNNIKGGLNLKNIIGYNINIEKNFENKIKYLNNIILDIDLDFFAEKERNGSYVLNKESMDTYFEIIKKYSNKIFLMTIALSPECCGGWDNAEKILKCFVEKFNLDLEVPLKCCE